MLSKDNHLYTKISEKNEDWAILLVDISPCLASILEHSPFWEGPEDFRNLSVMQLNQTSNPKKEISFEFLTKMKWVIDFFYTLTGTRCNYRGRSVRWSVDDVGAFF